MDEYYSYLQKIWANGGGWSACYYSVFSKVVNDNDYRITAEIGAGYGFHSEEILKNTKVEKHYIVDPMREYANDLFSVDVVANGGFEALVLKIKELLSKYSDRYTWYRKPSVEITNDEIPDGSLDAVFIDGDHSYNAVKQDLPFWWNKIRKGGSMLGDDYFMDSVKQAVDEFAQNNNLDLKFLYKENGKIPDYKIYQFIKYK